MIAQSVAYDIHGILTVESDVALPELEAFKTERLNGEPTVRVLLGDIDVPRSDNGSRTVTYRERTGQHGFAIRLELGHRASIVTSPFLRTSPHVLYTNAVEPVLRWAFVERGYALVHGACLSSDGRAFIITARTDTGKTTTVLKTLDAHPEYCFLSDDLTLLREDGTVLPYPKPLTISRHTLQAVNTPLLSRSERTALFFQSRLHSKSGRSFGFLLTRMHLPMATMNAIVQRIVPPPKYHIQRLVPHAQLAKQARLAGIVVIERGAARLMDLNREETVETILANSDDSYGFPPYEEIKEYLYNTDAGDLREEERRIITAAVEYQPAVVMRSETRNWFLQIPDFIGRATLPAPVTRFEPMAAGVEAAGD
jgi:dolichol-phosphate mannosyltransferase